jgi:Flp pilus assembly protein TadD
LTLLGREEEAKKEYENVLSLNKKNRAALSNLAVLNGV